jgi:hypothetical protein
MMMSVFRASAPTVLVSVTPEASARCQTRSPGCALAPLRL